MVTFNRYVSYWHCSRSAAIRQVMARGCVHSGTDVACERQPLAAIRQVMAPGGPRRDRPVGRPRLGRNSAARVATPRPTGLGWQSIAAAYWTGTMSKALAFITSV